MRITPFRTGVIVVAAAAGLMAAAAAGGRPTTSSSAALAASLTASAADLQAPTGTSPQTGAGTADPSKLGSPTLVNVRTGRHERYDRTVFDFTGGTPSYRVEYGTLVGLGTGKPIPLAGAAALRVVFRSAFAHDIDTGAITYDTSRVLNPSLPTLRQVKFGGDFEGVVSSGLGLADRVGFRVFILRNPDRVVVDVAHQPTQPFGTSRVLLGDASADTSVRGIRGGSHPGYDRLVFDLNTTKVPLVFVAYRQTTATIVVGFSGQNVPAVVGGPRNVTFGLRQLRSVSWSVYDNGTASAFVTTTRRAGFRVMVLSNPTRLVVDIHH